MSSPLPPQLTAELLDDFYTECDEHLTAIRQAILALESSVGRAQPDPASVEKAFRLFHSVKGNAAIVGLRPAEELAHSAEDFLSALSRGTVTLTEESSDLLMGAIEKLEQIIAAHREKRSIPDAAVTLAKLRMFTGRVPETAPQSEASSHSSAPASDLLVSNEIEEARAAGLNVWRFTFTPTRDLDQRGVNLNTVRGRIGALGKILQATPQVHGNRGISFEFLAALRETPSELAAWEADGIVIQCLEQSGSEPAAPGQAGFPSDASPMESSFVAPSHVVRVDLSRLDELMRITGEMVIHRARLEDQICRLAARDGTVDARTLQEVNTSLARDLRELRESIMRVRLVPAAEMFARMPFVVRDLARDTGKKVRLTLSGQQTEIDKYVVERLKDPLLHLIRNSVSHGIEVAGERLAAGKPAEATIFLQASTSGDSVLIETGDDGRGIDVEAVKARAAELGIAMPPAVNGTGLLNAICLPGFSTRDEADRGAGRGVGMAVVSNTIRELGGTLSLETEKDRGVRFCLRLPLTLAIADVLILSANGQTCAVPQSFVQEVLQMNEHAVHCIRDTEVVPYRNGVLPIIRLRSLFGAEPPACTSQPMLVLTSDRGSAGLVVDRIQGQREVVVRALSDPLLHVPGVAGATELGDGRPVLILDAASLTSGIVRPNEDEGAVAPKASGLAVAI